MRKASFWLGPILALSGATLLLMFGHDRDIAVVGFVALLCVVWWIFEPIPIPLTSLLPLSVLPMLGVLTPADVGQSYGSPIILLLLGGFLLSQAMEHSGAHRRVAVGMVRIFGANSGSRLVLGFMVAAAVLSMWISNTATTLMLLPVVLAVLNAAPNSERLAAPLLLGVAYAASVGGLGTPIGTPPNLIFMQVYQETTGREIGFTQWMGWALPVVVVMVPLMAWILTRNVRGPIAVTLPTAGAWRADERRVMIVFGLTALAWVTRGAPYGGWSTWLNLPHASDASVALLAVVVMAMLPNGKGEKLLNWEQAVKIPWGVLLLFGGGICLAKGFVSSGMSDLMGGIFASAASIAVYLLILGIALAVTFMTEATSNTASTTLLMPVLAAAALGAGIAPEVMMVPAAMSASCAFMLPVATAPNSVVYGSGLVTTARMAREGVAFNLLGALVISAVCYFMLT